MLERLKQLGWTFDTQPNGKIEAVRKFGNSEFRVFFISIDDLESNWFDKFTASYDELYVYRDEIRKIVDLFYEEDNKLPSNNK